MTLKLTPATGAVLNYTALNWQKYGQNLTVGIQAPPFEEPAAGTYALSLTDADGTVLVAGNYTYTEGAFNGAGHVDQATGKVVGDSLNFPFVQAVG